jgi:gluconate 5-dehydrogenase
VSDFLAELFSLKGRVAMVTGGSSGIGAAMASALAFAGARVVLVARDPTRLSAAADGLREAGCQAAWISTDRAEVKRASTAVIAAFGDPDILVNCAGVNLRPPLEVMTEDDWNETLAVNLTAPFLLGQRFGPAMAERGWGRIINITSQQAHRAFGNSGGYGPSKAALAALTRSQSEAWAPSGVTVNAICPGFVATPLTEKVASDPVRAAALAKRTMVGRNGEPTDFAGTVVFLASPASDFITGQTIFVDGGFSVT